MDRIDLSKIRFDRWKDNLDRMKHFYVILDFLSQLNEKSDHFVLKGGTALMVSYGLDRFSENIDLDSQDPKIESIVKEFCDERGYSYRVAKDTKTVKKYFIQYPMLELMKEKALKIEVSYRNKNINNENVKEINGITVYDINYLLKTKRSAFEQRDKIRDLYDIAFILKNYWNELDKGTIEDVKNAFIYRGLEHCDYLLQTQKDDFIDPDKMYSDFIDITDKMGILYDDYDADIEQTDTKSSQNIYEDELEM